MDTQNAVSERTRWRKRRPSLATVIALLAMVVALATTAQALPGRNSVQSNDIQRNAVTTKKIKNSAVTAKKIKNSAVTTKKINDHAMWALVRSDGVVIARSGVASVAVLSTGFYGITFAKPIKNRALMATVYNDSAGDGQVNVRYCDPTHPAFVACFTASGPNVAMVNTEDSAGGNAARTFLVMATPLTPGTQISPRAIPRSGNREGR